MDTTTSWISWMKHVDNDLDIVKGFTTTPMECMVEPQTTSYRVITLPQSNDSATSTISLAVDMVQIMEDITVMTDLTVHGICANGIIISL